MNHSNHRTGRFGRWRKDRRKFDDPKYVGPERRIEMKRKIALDKVISALEKQLQ